MNEKKYFSFFEIHPWDNFFELIPGLYFTSNLLSLYITVKSNAGNVI